MAGRAAGGRIRGSRVQMHPVLPTPRRENGVWPQLPSMSRLHPVRRACPLPYGLPCSPMDLDTSERLAFATHLETWTEKDSWRFET